MVELLNSMVSSCFTQRSASSWALAQSESRVYSLPAAGRSSMGCGAPEEHAGQAASINSINRTGIGTERIAAQSAWLRAQVQARRGIVIVLLILSLGQFVVIVKTSLTEASGVAW